MKRYDRQLFRTAQQIHDALHGRPAAESLPPLPEDAWRELVRTHRLLQRANELGWSTADAMLQAVRWRASELNQAMETLLRQLPPVAKKKHCSVRSVYEDLLALSEEFDEVRIDRQAQLLSAVTPPINLEGVELGRFEIRLDWNTLADGGLYKVRALDPCRAASNRSVTHPHVQDNVLCEGEGRLAIRTALQQGRILDFFLLVRQVLVTYNAGSPYVQLGDWSGISCSDCACTSDSDDCGHCERCSESLCGDCTRSCGRCDRTLCSGCSRMCSSCEMDYCSGCVSACSACGETLCGECRTGGRCQTCLNNEEEEDESNEEAASVAIKNAEPAVADAEP